MKCGTNKDKGRLGLSVAVGYYGSLGYTVSVPLNDTQDYDLVVDKNGTLKKVQVKCTGMVTKYGRYSVSVKSCGGTKGTTYAHVKDQDIDILFVVCTNGWLFEIPKELITQSTTINLSDVRSKFLGKSETDYSQYLVGTMTYEFHK